MNGSAQTGTPLSRDEHFIGLLLAGKSATVAHFPTRSTLAILHLHPVDLKTDDLIWGHLNKSDFHRQKLLTCVGAIEIGVWHQRRED